MRDVSAIVRAYRRAGFKVVRSRHWKIYDASGHMITVIGASPNSAGAYEAQRTCRKLCGERS